MSSVRLIASQLDAQVVLRYKGRLLAHTTYAKQKKAALIVSAKELNHTLDELLQPDGRSQGHKPKKAHT